MRFLNLALLASTTLGASFVPIHSLGNSHKHSPTCHPLEPNTTTVDTLVNNYAQLIGNYSSALGKSFVAENMTDVSDSINTLAGIPLGSVTFGSKTAFLANQETQAKIPLVVKAISAVTRDTIVIRWTQTFGEAALPASGISILGFVCGGSEWKLSKVWTEFNSLVYFEDVGGVCAYPTS